MSNTTTTTTRKNGQGTPMTTENQAAMKALADKATLRTLANKPLADIIMEINLSNIGTFIKNRDMLFKEYCADIDEDIRKRREEGEYPPYKSAIGFANGNKLVDILASLNTPCAMNDDKRRAVRELLSDLSFDEYLDMLKCLAVKEDGSIDEEVAEHYRELKNRISWKYGYSRTLFGGLKRIFDRYAQYWREYDHVRHILKCKRQLDETAYQFPNLMDREIGACTAETAESCETPPETSPETPLDSSEAEVEEAYPENDEDPYDSEDDDEPYDNDPFYPNEYDEDDYEYEESYDLYEYFDPFVGCGEIDRTFHEYDAMHETDRDYDIIPASPRGYYYIEALEYGGGIPFYTENSIYSMLLMDHDFSPENIKREAETCFSDDLRELIEKYADEKSIEHIMSSLDGVYDDIYELLVRPFVSA